MTSESTEDVGDATQPPSRGRVILITGIIAAVIIAIVALALILPNALKPTHRFEGIIALISSKPGTIVGTWDDCSGGGGYDDFTAGAPTTIKDGQGTIVGSVSAQNLSGEILDDLAADLKPTGYGSTPEEIIATVKKYEQVSCHLYISGTVEDSDYYTFTFSHRGDFTYSRQELEDKGWYVELSLGD